MTQRDGTDDNRMVDGEAVSSASGVWRFRIGALLLALGFLAPAAIPLVARSGLDSTIRTLLSGALAVGLPEVMMLVAAAVMGKDGFARLKRVLSGYVKEYGPAEQVGPVRYRIGLVMFAAPLVLGFGGPYLGAHLPTYEAHPVRWAVGGDFILFASFFVLGGEFWDKLRSLFVHGARAVFPESARGEA